MSLTIDNKHCYHCGLPNTENEHFYVRILGEQYNMCCPGCQSVATAIVENGLEDYYRFRTAPAEKGDELLDETLSRLKVYDQVELQEEFVFDAGKHKQIQLTVEGISCPACAWLIEKQLSKCNGVAQIAVNVSSKRATVTWDNQQITLSEILIKLKNIGYESLPFQIDNYENIYNKEYKNFLKKLGLAGLMTMQVMMLAMGQYFDILGSIDIEAINYFNAISLLLTTPVVLYSGSIFYLSAFKAFQAKTVNMDVPVTIAIFATYIAGIVAVNNDGGEVYFESICMFVFFLLIGRFLEHRSRHKAYLVCANMHKLIPVTAQKFDHETNSYHSVLAKQLKVNDVVLVKAGENVPIDGVIVDGQSEFDESMLTGEFSPVLKTSGQPVYASSLNQNNTVKIRVVATLKNAMMSQILRLQELASSEKPSMSKISDVLSRYFVSAVLVLSCLCYGAWYLYEPSEAFWVTISVLVATCPCALGLATPSAITCTIARLQKEGILVKRADVIESVAKISDIIFDKTGTLTNGAFSIRHYQLDPTNIKLIKSFDAFSSLSYLDDKAFVNALLSSIESHSEHPIAAALKHLSDNTVDLTDIKVSIGGGLQGKFKEHLIKVGSQQFVNVSMHHFSLDAKDANVFIAVDDKILAALNLNDTIKSDAKTTIEALQSKDITILSGDSYVNVQAIAAQLDIKKVVAEQSPDLKLDYLKTLLNNEKTVMMLGDGINDAPVLAAANVSVAVGNASDLAKNAADVILLQSNLKLITRLINIAQRGNLIIKQNIAWALSYNLLVLPFALLGYLTPWQAALGMSLSSVIVVYNSTRLLNK